MLLKNIYIYGILTIVTAQTAESFVLLTANIDDIKRLVSKFVSEESANSMTNFIKEIVDNILEGPNEQQKNKTSNILTQYIINDFSSHSENKSILHEDVHKPIKTKEEKLNKYKSIQKFETNTKSITKDEGIYDFSKERKPIYSKPKSMHMQKKRFSKQKAPEIPRKSTMGYAETILIKDDDKGFKNLARYSHKLAYISGKLKKSSNVETSVSASEFFKDLQRAVDHTTAKERNEFDQYDNTYYPKKLIATSGPTLPKMPKEQWWGNKVGLSTRNKSWF